MSRRDDLISFFFVILDLLNEQLPWRNSKDDKEEIKKTKEMCLLAPQINLPLNNKNKNEIYTILSCIQSLKFPDKPNYNFIRNELRKMRINDFNKKFNTESSLSLHKTRPSELLLANGHNKSEKKNNLINFYNKFKQIEQLNNTKKETEEIKNISKKLMQKMSSNGVNNNNSNLNCDMSTKANEVIMHKKKRKRSDSNSNKNIVTNKLNLIKEHETDNKKVKKQKTSSNTKNSNLLNAMSINKVKDINIKPEQDKDKDKEFSFSKVGLNKNEIQIPKNEPNNQLYIINQLHENKANLEKEFLNFLLSPASHANILDHSKNLKSSVQMQVDSKEGIRNSQNSIIFENLIDNCFNSSPNISNSTKISTTSSILNYNLLNNCIQKNSSNSLQVNGWSSPLQARTNKPRETLCKQNIHQMLLNINNYEADLNKTDKCKGRL